MFKQRFIYDLESISFQKFVLINHMILFFDVVFGPHVRLFWYLSWPEIVSGGSKFNWPEIYTSPPTILIFFDFRPSGTKYRSFKIVSGFSKMASKNTRDVPDVCILKNKNCLRLQFQYHRTSHNKGSLSLQLVSDLKIQQLESENFDDLKKNMRVRKPI